MTWEQLELFENWLPIVGYEGKYEVSNWGRVRRVAGAFGNRAGKLFQLQKTQDGYLKVTLSGVERGAQKTFTVHRIVMAAFVGLCPLGKEVHHIDGDKTHNSVLNLRYVTSGENKREDFKAGRRDQSGERHHGGRKLTRDQVIEIRRLRTEGMTQKAIAMHFSVSNQTISDIGRGKRWKADSL